MTDQPIRIRPGTIYTIGKLDRPQCWCCLATGDNDAGSECVACDGSGGKPDSGPCQPLCREPERATWM